MTIAIYILLADREPQDLKYYQAKSSALEAEVLRLKNILRLNQPYDIFEILGKLSEAADHLLAVHDCDCMGYEEIKAAMESAKKILEARNA